MAWRAKQIFARRRRRPCRPSPSRRPWYPPLPFPACARTCARQSTVARTDKTVLSPTWRFTSTLTLATLSTDVAVHK